MKISGVNLESIVDGVGMRTTIYVSGCSWNCKGCQNMETHDPSYGEEFTDEVRDKIFEEIKKRSYITGITISGGDPLYNLNLDSIIKLLKDIKHEFGNSLNVWLYTGYKFESIKCDKKRKQILKYIDVLVDGKFEIDKRDISLAYRGSSNQRIIDVKKTTSLFNLRNKIYLWKE